PCHAREEAVVSQAKRSETPVTGSESGVGDVISCIRSSERAVTRRYLSRRLFCSPAKNGGAHESAWVCGSDCIGFLLGGNRMGPDCLRRESNRLPGIWDISWQRS